jgi:hypothetical protein
VVTNPDIGLGAALFPLVFCQKIQEAARQERPLLYVLAVFLKHAPH